MPAARLPGWGRGDLPAAGPPSVQVEGEGGRVAWADGEPELLPRGRPARWTGAGEGI